ncbi:hypothetical protein QYE76_051157 [Lolium multiflorum]|uniref:Uncharacterized protein n=1 Tax=Lolium multiflorum TaxID=4521 RepID=A0AAD8SRD0_LOLMU|nr:hypothetical protein QYE76_051157 [Lolium multiflorum]
MKRALKKMALQFNNYKKKLDNFFVKQQKTPNFNGPYEKIEDHWEAFVKYKTSERAKKRSATNTKNASNKMYFHTMGRGGYKAGMPKWEKWENDLIEKGIQPEMAPLYPVDYIIESTPCELHFKTMGYLSSRRRSAMSYRQYLIKDTTSNRFHLAALLPGWIKLWMGMGR